MKLPLNLTIFILLSSCNKVVINSINNAKKSTTGTVSQGSTVHAICNDRSDRMTYTSRVCQDETCNIVADVKEQCDDLGQYIANIKELTSGSGDNPKRRQSLIKWKGSDKKHYSFYLNVPKINQVLKEYHSK
jgi:hypothetical protein